jgi:hypothetical protein
MNRFVSVSLMAIMACVCAGQAWLLGKKTDQPVASIELHPSRLVEFMRAIEQTDPLIYQNLLLNLERLHKPSAEQNVTLEETVVAQSLLVRLKGER